MVDTTEDIKAEKQQDNNKKKVIGIPFKPGVSGNPAGRPKGKTIKEMVRQHLDDNPEELKSFVKHFIEKNRELAWQMLEGRPQQDVTSGGEKLPTPLLNVLNNNSDKEGSEPNKED